MKNALSLLGALLMLTTPCLAGDENEKPKATAEEKAASESAASEETKTNESPLVQAARRAKERREGGDKSRISITNEDIEKSEGKLIQSSSKPLEPLPAASDVEKTMRDVTAAKARRTDRTSLQAAINEHQKEVDDLERELRRIEETYYNEDDPDYREDVLAKKFDDTKGQLEAAREKLAAARKALSSGN